MSISTKTSNHCDFWYLDGEMDAVVHTLSLDLDVERRSRKMMMNFCFLIFSGQMKNEAGHYREDMFRMCLAMVLHELLSECVSN